MTLLTTVFAAVSTTILWYFKDGRNQVKLGTLSLIYWGAALMWTVDAAFEYAELGMAYFIPSPADMLNDFFLGISVVALGLVIWLALLLFKDPKGVIRQTLHKSNVS